jgi:protein-tyrosine-phosphatase
MVKLLFVCVGNSCRSQIAEAMANHLGEGKVLAFSAGTHPLGVISRGTLEVLRDKGIGLEGHRSKGLRDVPISEMDVVVEMGLDVECPLPADFKGRLIQWNIPDPYSLGQDYFRDVRDLIEGQVRRLLANLAGETGNSKIETRKSKMETGKSKMETRRRKPANRNPRLENPIFDFRISNFDFLL